MPIHFRCTSCQLLLSITRRKAGQPVNCPSCGAKIVVPTIEEAQRAAGEAAPPPGDEDHERAPPPAEELIAAKVAAGPRHEGRSEEDEEEGFRIRRRAAEEGGLDMTPMVDVTFQLLIFFMLTASFSVQKSMQSEAPEPEQEGAAQTTSYEDIESNSVVVEVDGGNRILVDGDLVAGIDGLVDVLTAKAQAESPPKNELLIEADYRASHGTVVAVTDAGMEAGMQKIRRVSRRTEE